ncbi:Pyridine nucleotide-disulphide oxidoreductase [uncultured archaeon]|nr:Pyridine nucleotide-disulphide oxidoreductase [uncultured archaeon]
MVKRAVIVGAGPAGIGAAYTLAKNSKDKLEIVLIDQGKRVENREKESSFDFSNGFSGVGANADGKFVFETVLGRRQIGTNLGELGRGLDREYLIKAREIFQPFYENFTGKPMQSPSEDRVSRGREIARLAGRNDMDYVLALDYHIGTDRLPSLMKLIQDDLERAGVQIVTETRAVDFDQNQVYLAKTSNLTAEPVKMNYDYLVVCPGRDGSHWLSKTLKQRNIKHGTRPIDIGVRVEADAEIMRHLTDVERDVKLEFKHPNGDMIRTFCVCPYGQVTSERKDPKVTEATYCLVNGESRSERISNNTNFALLVRMPLRDDASNGDYGRKIAELYEIAARTDRVILQRYGDLRQGRSSKKEKMLEWRVQPTLDPEKFMAGDIRVGMPARIMDDIRYGIERLSAQGLIEGLNQDSTLLYGPEIKFHGLSIHTDPYLQSVSVPNLYFAGDGTGISRGIGGAMASGIRAAEGILRSLK